MDLWINVKTIPPKLTIEIIAVYTTKLKSFVGHELQGNEKAINEIANRMQMPKEVSIYFLITT